MLLKSVTEPELSPPRICVNKLAIAADEIELCFFESLIHGDARSNLEISIEYAFRFADTNAKVDARSSITRDIILQESNE